MSVIRFVPSVVHATARSDHTILAFFDDGKVVRYHIGHLVKTVAPAFVKAEVLRGWVAYFVRSSARMHIFMSP